MTVLVFISLSFFPLPVYIITQHPDKCQDDLAATAKFQALSIVHATLSDEGRRGHYDETGEIEDEDSGLNQSEQEWYGLLLSYSCCCYWLLIITRFCVPLTSPHLT